MKKKETRLIIFVVLACFFIISFGNSARAANCPGTCRRVCESDESTTWFGGLRFDNCSWYEGCCVKAAAGGNCPGTCRRVCESDEQVVGWGALSFNNCSGLEGCCVKVAQSTTNQQSSAGNTPLGGSVSSSSNPGGLVPCDTNCTLCHLVIGFKNIYEFFLKLLFVATMLAITVSGVFYMISSGSKTLTEMAKKALTYSLTAFVIGMAGWILVNTVMTALGYKHPYGGNWWEFTCDTSLSKGPVSSGSPSWQTGNLTGKGCVGVIQNAKAMEGWSYTQNSVGRMADGSADCSSMIDRSYAAAGCNSPGGDTAAMYGNAVSVNDQSSLRVGDAIVYRNGDKGHVVMCLDNGCNTVMSANSANGIYERSYSNDLNKYNAKVIRVSDFCPDC